MTAAKPQVSAGDWDLTKSVAAAYGVDPYLLVAIGMHETGWGTQGDGRAPGNGSHGHILGVGSFDSGSVPKWTGLALQLVQGAHILKRNDVHTIGDVQAGKLHVQNGSVKWASADTADTGYSWSTSVVNIATRLEGQKAYEGTLPTASSAYDTKAGIAEAVKILTAEVTKGGGVSGVVGGVFGGIGGAIDRATGAVGGVGDAIDRATGAVGGVGNAIGGIGSFFAWFANVENEKRIAYVIVGIGLLILAVIALTKSVAPQLIAGIAPKMKGSPA